MVPDKLAISSNSVKKIVQRRLARWSAADVQLQGSTYGRLLTGSIEFSPGSEIRKELVRRLDLLEQQARPDQMEGA
jgi:hypothetical protein